MTFLFFFCSLLAALEIPENLNKNEREKTLEILGLGTSSKILTIPYPLGGYAGVELALSMESVPLEDLSRFGDQTEDQGSFEYPKISIGKGLLEDFDLFMHFIPYSEQTDLSEYGALIRWNIYQSQNIPGNISFIAHMNSSNIQDLFISESYGYEVTAGITVESLSLYFGIGQVQVKGRFVGGDNAITDSGEDEVEKTQKTHSIIGGSYHRLPYFFAFQIDQYETTVMSAKVGLRF